MSSPTHKEDKIGQTWDRCYSDALFKMGGGVLIGTVFSLLFVRKRWPIVIGGGFGLGMAYSNCEKELNAAVALTSTSSSKK